MKNHVVLRLVSKLMIPVIVLFALFVQFHGEYSPGGGFQAGIILAAAIVLHALIFGLPEVQRAVPPGAVHLLAALGALLYIGVGLWTLLAGGNFLEYKVLARDAHAGESTGILLIELGVGITVASVVIGLFYSFAGRGHKRRS